MFSPALLRSYMFPCIHLFGNRCDFTTCSLSIPYSAQAVSDIKAADLDR